MRWPNEAGCKRIADLWKHAYGSPSHTNRSESENAFAALQRLQADLGLSDCELAFIAESRINSDSASDESPPDPLSLILHLFDEVHLIFPSFERAVVVALWVLYCYVFDQYLHSPRLLIKSEETGCGKTLLLMCIEQLINEPFYSPNFSPAVIYHQLQGHLGTKFLLDEIENSSLWVDRGLLLRIFDAGHRQGGHVDRVVGRKLVRYPCFGPLALAGIAKYRFPSQLLDRSIIIEMMKHLEGLDELWPNDERFTKVRILISALMSDFRRPQYCRIPFTGRTANNWRSLVEIAQTFGYPETARAAALAVHRPSDDPVVLLLFDIYRVFEQRKIDRIWTDELLHALHELEDAKWDEFWGLGGDEDPHKLRRGELYRMVKTKRILSRTVWKNINIKGERKSNNGFLREQFEPVWRQLFPNTSTQSSKIIALPRHKMRYAAGTDDTADDADDTADDDTEA